MVIWLRQGQSALGDHGTFSQSARVGATTDVIPRAALGELLTLEKAYAALDVERDVLLASARDEAARLVEQARTEATDILEQARLAHASAHDEGYHDGGEQALADWMEGVAEINDAQNHLQSHMRERLAHIVTLAVEQIVHVEQRGALFDRAQETINQIVDGAAYLRVVVHPDDHATARAAFDRFAARRRELGSPVPISVVADQRLEPGSCLCESDFGTVDAGLGTQLRSLRQAVSRALGKTVATARAQQPGPGPDPVDETEDNA